MFLDIQATIECRFTLKRVSDMITYSFTLKHVSDMIRTYSFTRKRVSGMIRMYRFLRVFVKILNYHIFKPGLDTSNTIVTFPNMVNRNILKMWEDTRKAEWHRYSIIMPWTWMCGRLIGHFFFFGKILSLSWGTSSSLFAIKFPNN